MKKSICDIATQYKCGVIYEKYYIFFNFKRCNITRLVNIQNKNHKNE